MNDEIARCFDLTNQRIDNLMNLIQAQQEYLQKQAEALDGMLKDIEMIAVTNRR